MAKTGLLARLTAAASVLATGRLTASEGAPRGGRAGRRSALFDETRRHLNSVIASAGPTLRARCRFAARENALAISAKEIWVSYAVGTGWTPSSQHPNPEINKALHEWFKAWTDIADFDGRTDFYGLCGLAAGEEWEAGEVFFRLVRKSGAGLKLQMMQSEQLPYSNMAAAGYVPPAGHEIRLGVEFDAAGERVAYHFHRQHPGDGTKMQISAEELVRIPAEDVIHFYEVKAPGQIRGYPKLAGALVPSFKLEEYEDALLERAAQSAKYIATIQRVSPDGDATSGATDAAAAGSREYTLETGTMYELDADEKVEFNNPPDPGSNFDDFERRMTAKACIAMGIPYAETSGDLKNTTFVSIRVGRQPLKRRCDRWGHGTLVFLLCRRAWTEALRFDLLEGRVALPRGASRDVSAYSRVNWTPTSWEYTNPVDDAKADKIMVDEGFKPRSVVQEERGYNAEETDAQIAADRRREETLDLRLGPRQSAAEETDGDRAGDGAGRPQDPPPAEPEPKTP